MAKSSSLTFFELCRLCLEAHGTIDIWNTEHLDHDIFLVTTVKISAKDKLPQKICSKCLDIVKNANKLRNMAIKNESNLKSLFGDEISDDELDELNQIKIHIMENFNDEKSEKSDVKQDTDSSSVIKTSIVSGQNIFETIKEENLAENNTSKNISRSETDGSDRKRRRSSADDGIVYVCTECHKTFNTWKKLYHHQRSHSKNFLCPLEACGKKFSSKGDLQKHKRTHTGEKPFQCDVCAKSFSQNVTLKVHKENVHGLLGV